jgi:hypothetical protein
LITFYLYKGKAQGEQKIKNANLSALETFLTAQDLAKKHFGEIHPQVA